jgi:Asp-tRNA(Asn)/Glu-tRNA(Gln) amidotransferase A subunit family amidase
MGDLHEIGAAEALRSFRDRSLSPVELMEAVIARAERVEPHINAFAVTYYDEALEAARLAEARYVGSGPRPRALEGLPVATKEETPIAGRTLEYGSLAFKGHVATKTAPVAARILAAGGIVHARTATPEFSCAPFTHSRLWGVTRNPWSAAHAAGGSSGGSAAALAAGSAVLANGSDIGGSIRIPAAFCGVVGFKPPFGRVPESPPFNLDHYCHEGPLARTVADCALFENVIAGPHPHDVSSLRPKLRIPAGLGPIDGWRVALSRDLGGYPVDYAVARNLEAAADALRDAGAVVEDVDLGWDRASLVRAGRAHFRAIFGAWIATVLEEHRDLLTPYAVRFAEDCLAIPESEYLTGLELEGEIYAALGDVLTRHRLLIAPGFSVPALDAGEDYVDRGPVVNGVEYDDVYDVLMTLPFNICSRCPVMSMPSGLSPDGVPTGVQIVGRTFDDVSVFRAAAALGARISIGLPAVGGATPTDLPAPLPSA